MLGLGLDVAKPDPLLSSDLSNNNSFIVQGVSGGNYFTVPLGLNFGTNEAFSISAWFKIDVGEATNWTILSSKATSALPGIYLQCLPTYLEFGYQDAPGFNGNKMQFWTNVEGSYRDGTWHNYIATYGGGGGDATTEVATYVDGVAVGAILRNNCIFSVDGDDFDPGVQTTSVLFHNTTTGSILTDEIAIWDVTLSALNIAAIATEPIDLNSLDQLPVNWWRGEGDMVDSGSRGEVPTESGTVTYSTDTP